MSRRKTAAEIQAETTALRELLPRLPAARREIQAALRVLDENWSHDRVYDELQEGSDAFEGANTARMWRDGDSTSDALSVQWLEML